MTYITHITNILYTCLIGKFLICESPYMRKILICEHIEKGVNITPFPF